MEKNGMIINNGMSVPSNSSQNWEELGGIKIELFRVMRGMSVPS
jgi:hypothetical protein